jgi:hypothetical protein
MASLKLVYGPETRRVSKVPGSISELYAKIQDLFGVSNPSLQYKDEDNDIITVQTDEEYLDALQFSQGNLKLILNEPSVYHSAITMQSALISQPLESRSFSETPRAGLHAVSEEIKTEETGTDAIPIATHEFSCGTGWNVEDRACSASVGTTEVAINTHANSDASMLTQLIDLAESSSNTATFESKFSDTEPLQVNSVPTSTQPIEVCSKESHTELTFEKASGPKMIDSEFQCEILESKDSELMYSIRSIVREELGEIKKSLAGTVVFEGSVCKECGKSPVVGSLYICSICDSYTLCEDCEENTAHSHFFIKLKKPIHQMQISRRKKSNLQPERSESLNIKLEDNKIYESVDLSQPPELPPVSSQPIEIKPVESKPVSPPNLIQISPSQAQDISVSQDYSQLKLSSHLGRVRPTGLDITILLGRMEEMGLKDKASNISALIKNGYQLEKAIETVLQGL